MRKIIVSEFITLDNVIEGPGPDDAFDFAGWTMPYTTAEIMQFKRDELFDGGALLLGKLTYDGFAKAWPTMEGTGEFGEHMNSIPKFVVSNSGEALAWNNSTLISGDTILDQIKALKEQEGKDILVFGSSELIKTLIAADLIDEYRLLVYPVTLGKGKRLFKDGTHTSFKLTETTAYDNGVVLLRYAPKAV